MKHDETRPANLGRAPRCGARTRAGPRANVQLCVTDRGAACMAAEPRRAGSKNGNFKNGDWTADAIQERQWLRSLVRSFANNGTTE